MKVTTTPGSRRVFSFVRVCILKKQRERAPIFGVFAKRGGCYMALVKKAKGTVLKRGSGVKQASPQARPTGVSLPGRKKRSDAGKPRRKPGIANRAVKAVKKAAKGAVKAVKGAITKKKKAAKGAVKAVKGAITKKKKAAKGAVKAVKGAVTKKKAPPKSKKTRKCKYGKGPGGGCKRKKTK